MPVLQTKDLKYYYFSDRIIFENLNLVFERGKVYVILGASGSGKTTLLSLLGGLDAPKGAKSCSRGKILRRWGWKSTATTAFRSCSRTTISLSI